METLSQKENQFRANISERNNANYFQKNFNYSPHFGKMLCIKANTEEISPDLWDSFVCIVGYDEQSKKFTCIVSDKTLYVFDINESSLENINGMLMKTLAENHKRKIQECRPDLF